jgi:hypothetical protein
MIGIKVPAMGKTQAKSSKRYKFAIIKVKHQQHGEN